MKAMLQDTSMPSCTCASTHARTHTHTNTHTHTLACTHPCPAAHARAHTHAHAHTHWPATEERTQADPCGHNSPQGGPRYHSGPQKGPGVPGQDVPAAACFLCGSSPPGPLRYKRWAEGSALSHGSGIVMERGPLNHVSLEDPRVQKPHLD